MIRWGVLGLGSIATRFLESLVLHTEGEGYAAASYTAEKGISLQNCILR